MSSSAAGRAMYPDLALAQDQREGAKSERTTPEWGRSTHPLWTKPVHEKVAIPDQWLAKIGLIKVK